MYKVNRKIQRLGVLAKDAWETDRRCLEISALTYTIFRDGTPRLRCCRWLHRTFFVHQGYLRTSSRFRLAGSWNLRYHPVCCLESACMEFVVRKALCVGAVCGVDVGSEQVFARVPLSTRVVTKEVLRFFLPNCFGKTSMNHLLRHW